MRSDPVFLACVIAAALCVGGALILAFSRRPRFAMAVWTAALMFFPPWLGIQVGIFVTVLTAVTVLAIASSLGARLRWSAIDTIMAAVMLSVLLGYVFGGAVWGHVQETLLMWFLPYVWGRLIASRVDADWISACLAVGATVVAVLAIIEVATGRNIFLLLPGAGSSVWGELQARDGRLRAEGAFGHSIALGGALAISSVFVLVARWPVWVRTLCLGIVGIATVLTLSRVGIIDFAITVLLAVLLLGAWMGRSMRITATAILAIGAIAAGPWLIRVMTSAGSEAEGSAAYRSDLLTLLNVMAPIGISPAREVTATGIDYYGGFRSIDSALILIGLRHGMITLTLVLILLAVLIISILSRRATPASVALLAQIPAFATVALITQYSALVWFIAGVAVTSYTLGAGKSDAHTLVAARDAHRAGVKAGGA